MALRRVLSWSRRPDDRPQLVSESLGQTGCAGGLDALAKASVVSLKWLVLRCAKNGLGRGARREHPRSGL